MSHIHKFSKHIALEDEQLPDNTGAVITYVGNPKGDFEITERFAGGAGTVECGSAVSGPNGETGVITEQSADFKYGWTEGGVGPIVEVVTKARVNLGTGVLSF